MEKTLPVRIRVKHGSCEEFTIQGKDVRPLVSSFAVGMSANGLPIVSIQGSTPDAEIDIDGVVEAVNPAADLGFLQDWLARIDPNALEVATLDRDEPPIVAMLAVLQEWARGSKR